MELVIIAAVAENGVIGKEGEIPWHEPADLEHFKEETMGWPCIMGRVTYDGIVNALGGPLPGRTNIVLSHEEFAVPEEAVNVHGIEAAVAAAEATGKERAYVIGGASVYEQFLDRADRMVLTHLDQRYDGDTFFPAWDRSAWTKVREEAGDGMTFAWYERAKG